MTLQQLKYMIEVANQGSINKAAQVLFISQPSLSNAIKDLEESINMTIFHRTSSGVSLTNEGAEFLGYAKQVVGHAKLLEEYVEERPEKQKFSVSTQHYSVAIMSFVQLIKDYGSESYEFNLRETKVQDIIQDVRENRSEVGIIYLNLLNEKAIKAQLSEYELEFIELFKARPMILVDKKHPIANKDKVVLGDLVDYPCLSFQQDEYNLFFFSEEILSTIIHSKNIKVSERATLYTLMAKLDGYTISTGIISNRLREAGIVAIDLDVNSFVKVGAIVNKDMETSILGEKYLEILKANVDSRL